MKKTIIKHFNQENLTQKLGKKYQLIEKCGSGNYGEVWKCFDNSIKRNVAIKFLRPYLPKEHIIEEAQKQANVQSRHVVTIHHLNAEKGFIDMEYCPSSLEKK